jgi:membrane dipeptidase
MTELKALLEGADGHAAIVRNVEEYRRAVENGKHACFIGVQGANALPTNPDALDPYRHDLLRITLLHLTNTAWGTSSAPQWWRRETGLSQLGSAFVEKMNELRIGIDLAHIHERGFWDAVRLADPSQPLLVTHTGVKGAHDHWRNLDDRQLKAIAASGGTVGIMYHSVYLGDGIFSGRIASVVRHIRHALRTVGSDHVSLGSDWDGAICTPRDMPTCAELPLLVEALLRDGVKSDTIQKILGQNFLRVVGELKGNPS